MEPSMTDPAGNADLRELVDTFIHLMRSFNKAKARLLVAAEHDIEWSAYLLLRSVARGEGPMRAAELAGALQSDRSTVSRQVAALVKDGYLERRADPADGRASLLVLTARAEELLAKHDRNRLEYFARVVEGWTDSDLKQFGALLQRFTESYDNVTTTDWITERVANRPAQAGSTN
jgi:DNA-binding MarR family transcriptional regulator